MYKFAKNIKKVDMSNPDVLAAHLSLKGYDPEDEDDEEFDDWSDDDEEDDDDGLYLPDIGVDY